MINKCLGYFKLSKYIVTDEYTIPEMNVNNKQC